MDREAGEGHGVRARPSRWRSSADPFGAAVDRPSWLLGVLWATGGLLALLWSVTGVPADGSPVAVGLLGGLATGLGAALLKIRTRLLQESRYVSLTILGAAAICVVLWWSGEDATGAPAILFVYVGVFACVALGNAAWSVLPVSAAMHAGTLALRGPDAWWGEWTMVWGATLVASVLMGAAVAANRRIMAEREALLDDLRAADETKTAFLRALGHDLSAPASNLSALARTVIERDGDLAVAQRRELLGRLEANAIRLHGDLEALLRLEELVPGRLRANLEPVWVERVALRAVERAGVPAARLDRHRMSGIVVAADATKLEHAIANLLSNALKYGAAGGPIGIGAYHEEMRTVVHVDDAGEGVPVSDRERIFEPLGRARVQDIEHGSGIGLSVVRAFARFHGGETWVEDAPGGGARFCIGLPRADPLTRFAARR
jgi:signal transduction histidine kinase